MTLYEAIERDKRKRGLVPMSSAPKAFAEVQPIVIDASVVTALAVKMKKAENEIDRLERDIEDLNVLFDLKSQEWEQYHHAGNIKKEAQTLNGIIALRKRIYKATTDLAQAKLTLSQTKTKLFPQEVYSW